MTKFESVNVIKAANIYFDGKVTSRTIEFSDGSTKTLGVMLPGEYTFNTGRPELMEITSGRVSWCPKGQTSWSDVSGGSSFRVEGDSSFQIKVHEVTDYICSFL
ncbi:MAG: pyrimidine/purine nucleoside phosphorylase [Planctomycetaceae bacterium]|nr:pyrimidine/purine nucleoside phosphorylase [Planctomycetaceae bacterium]